MFFKTENLCFSHYKQPLLLKDINIGINEGQKVVIVASKEMGKTTTFKILSGYENAYFGKISFKNKNLKDILDDDKNFSLIFSEPVFLTKKTIKENLDYFCEVCKIDKFSTEQIDKFLLDCNIDRNSGEKVTKLSLFEKRKLALLRVAVKQPTILFLDDQFEGLNKTQQIEMLQIYEKLLKLKKQTIFFAIGEISYKLLFKEDFKFDKFFYLCNANLVEYENNAEFEQRKDNYDVTKFLGGYSSILVDLVFENGKLKLERNSETIILSDELIDKSILSFENYDGLECIFVCFEDVDIFNISLSDIAKLIYQKKANLYDILTGDKLI